MTRTVFWACDKSEKNSAQSETLIKKQNEKKKLNKNILHYNILWFFLFVTPVQIQCPRRFELSGVNCKFDNITIFVDQQ